MGVFIHLAISRVTAATLPRARSGQRRFPPDRVSNIIRTRQNGDLSALLGLSSLTCVSKSASSVG